MTGSRRWNSEIKRRCVPRMLRSAPFFTAWCAAKPGSSQSAVFVTVPALRSGMKNAVPRPGHETYLVGLVGCRRRSLAGW
jgi:hypothetical protein